MTRFTHANKLKKRLSTEMDIGEVMYLSGWKLLASLTAIIITMQTLFSFMIPLTGIQILLIIV
jgi:hypothetical protein